YDAGLVADALLGAHDARVLEIGIGSEYQAALLRRLVGYVYPVERHEALAEQALERVTRLGYDNISVHVADGTSGWPEYAPYDNAIITAAGPDVPRAIVAQVVRGGTVILPVGTRKKQHLQRLRIRWLGFSREDLGRVAFVPLVGRYGWRE